MEWEAFVLKKFLLVGIFMLLILSGCQSSTLSLSEIDNVPRKIEEVISPDLILQLIGEGTKGSYIVFLSNGEVEASLSVEDNTINIIFDEENSQAREKKRNVYYLTKDSAHDTLIPFVNGEEMYFDVVTGI